MDALPISEISNLEYGSKNPGKVHAYAFDGHTPILLGAAKHLTETRNLNGKVALIFQPAEEESGGSLVITSF